MPEIQANINDKETNIEDIKKLVADFVNERDWSQYHTPKSLATAISIEAAELLEHFLFKPDSHIPPDMEAFTDEIADIMIYLLSLSNTLKIDNLAEIIYRKMGKNRLKYPVEKFAGDKYSKQSG
jgi:NTP pyrophosphatase (non-canonical NTP hydrolase)